jgi:hypothetical protein
VVRHLVVAFSPDALMMTTLHREVKGLKERRDDREHTHRGTRGLLERLTDYLAIEVPRARAAPLLRAELPRLLRREAFVIAEPSDLGMGRRYAR